MSLSEWMEYKFFGFNGKGVIYLFVVLKKEIFRIVEYCCVEC